MGAHLGMNGHERLAAEGSLKRLDERIFIDTQRLSILQHIREELEKLSIRLAPVLPMDHSARRNVIDAHHLLVYECSHLSDRLRRDRRRAEDAADELLADDAHMTGELLQA